ncbi:MAG: HAD-IIIC family phosphatase [Pirellulales bacterium]
MKLLEALNVVNQGRDLPSAGEAFLACGFTPLHLPTYLTAHYLRRQNERLQIQSGLYGDLSGNVERAADPKFVHRWVVVEWSDLDPRLGMRQPHGWRHSAVRDVVQTVSARLDQLTQLIRQHADAGRWVVSLPTLPLPPIFSSPRWQADAAALEIQHQLDGAAIDLASCDSVRLLNRLSLDAQSPVGSRHSVRDELASGYPYTLEHTHQLAQLLVQLAAADRPLRGIITDLDDTLWRGIVGDDGVDRVYWDLEHHAGGHGLYQGLLNSLAEIGVLVAVASKNDPNVVDQVLARPDLILDRKVCFPVEAHWQPKSTSVGRILEAWNIHPDSVVFIDDSPLELAEVQESFPALHCWRFPKGDDAAIVRMLGELRDRFGKSTVTDEDLVRSKSLRSSVHQQLTNESDPNKFLSSLQAELRIESGRPVERCLELINKTNQFNLNGRRWTDQQWRQRINDADRFLVSADYWDKFGPLGKIAVVSGERCERGAAGGPAECVRIDTWVMSCRAFSRRIEFAVLRQMFELLGADAIRLDFQATERNGPFAEFLIALGASAAGGEVLVRRSDLERVPEYLGKVVADERGG